VPTKIDHRRTDLFAAMGACLLALVAYRDGGFELEQEVETSAQVTSSAFADGDSIPINFT
jgi:hypothetical protein